MRSGRAREISSIVSSKSGLVIPMKLGTTQIYVENAGDFTVPLDAVESVHSGKVIFNCAKLDRRLRQAIGHANDEAGFLTSL